MLVFQETKARSEEWISSTLNRYNRQDWEVFECINKHASRNGVAILIHTGKNSGFTDIKEIYADSRSDSSWNWDKDKKVIMVEWLQLHFNKVLVNMS